MSAMSATTVRRHRRKAAEQAAQQPRQRCAAWHRDAAGRPYERCADPIVPGTDICAEHLIAQFSKDINDR